MASSSTYPSTVQSEMVPLPSGPPPVAVTVGSSMSPAIAQQPPVVVSVNSHRGEAGDFYRGVSTLTGIVGMLGGGFSLLLAATACPSYRSTQAEINAAAHENSACDMATGAAGAMLLALAFSLAVACLSIPMLRSGSALDGILGLMLGCALAFIFIGLYAFTRFMEWSWRSTNFPGDIAVALYVLFGLIAFVAACLWFGVLGSWKAGHGNFYAHGKDPRMDNNAGHHGAHAGVHNAPAHH